MDTDPAIWRWVWLIASLVLIAGEMFVPGTFILLPFGISAALAALLSLLDVDTAWTWVVFIAGGIALFGAMWQYARRWAATAATPIGVGADRMLGETGPVVVGVPAAPTGSGEVRVRGELWRAESRSGAPIEAGTVVVIVEVRGTRVVVSPVVQSSADEGVRS